MLRRPPISPLFPYTTLFRSRKHQEAFRDRKVDAPGIEVELIHAGELGVAAADADRRHRDAARDDRVTQLTSRSEEHTSELQSRQYLVCRLLLEKKKKLTTQE